jgi:hypothetical protein
MPKNNSKTSVIFLLPIICVLGFTDAKSQSFQDKIDQLETIESEQNTQDSQNFSLTLDKIDQSNFYNTAVIQALNKVTAKTSTLEIRIGYSIEFGKLSIVAHKCWKSPADQRPDSKILLEVFDNSSEEKNLIDNRIFYGWMMSSSPSISDLENPIYDITAITCK